MELHPWARTSASASACERESTPCWLRRSPTHHQWQKRVSRAPLPEKSLPWSSGGTHTRNA